MCKMCRNLTCVLCEQMMAEEPSVSLDSKTVKDIGGRGNHILQELTRLSLLMRDLRWMSF